MDIYNAIMKAADHIERHPELFDFETMLVPACGTPGCALGWTAHFMQFDHEDANVGDFAAKMLPWSEGAFYEKMNRVFGAMRFDWIGDAALCARTMRAYAAKYHAPAPVVPDWNAMAAKQTVSTAARSQELVS